MKVKKYKFYLYKGYNDIRIYVNGVWETGKMKLADVQRDGSY